MSLANYPQGELPHNNQFAFPLNNYQNIYQHQQEDNKDLQLQRQNNPQQHPIIKQGDLQLIGY